jgi:hypothetical protein
MFESRASRRRALVWIHMRRGDDEPDERDRRQRHEIETDQDDAPASAAPIEVGDLGVRGLRAGHAGHEQVGDEEKDCVGGPHSSGDRRRPAQ